MAEEGEESNMGVGFLYKTMLERDPRKRRVKPVKEHLLQLDFTGLGDSSDDSDFDLGKHGHKSSGSDNSESEDDDESRSKDSDDDEDDDDSNKDEDDDEEDGESAEEEMSIAALLAKANEKNRSTKAGSEETGTSISSAPLKVVVCCVCLGDKSEDDEIVDCDGCGVSVHEGCYGVSESLSVASTESSASTEPWFCEACKAGVKPHCELCPNLGGIYKETDAGRWVHLVCALYTPGVAFGDVDRLTPVTLFEMPYSKWGAKECGLCEDARYSRTGVCVGCDAGMCRNYFHVSCAQREGLLSEANPDEDIADPFFAYCKQHAEKSMVRAKRRNWLAVQSNNRRKQEAKVDEKEKNRVQRKLHRHRLKYQAAKNKRPPSWVPKEKLPRLLTTSAAALRRLMRKAELLGINTQMEQHTQKVDIRKKWHVAPALSVEFVSYYLDRNVRMNTMKSHLQDLLSQRDKLQEQEKVMRHKYDQISSDVKKLKEAGDGHRSQGTQLYRILSDFAGRHLAPPEIFKPPRKPVRSHRRDTPRSPPALIHQCGICNGTTDQHLLAKCDECRQHYHLGCLDPPLTRMPKKTKQFGWQCSECIKSTDDELDEKKAHANAPRKLREKIKGPVKFTPQLIGLKKKKKLGEKKKKVKPQKRVAKKRKLPETPDVIEISSECPMQDLASSKPASASRPSRVKTPKVKDMTTECCVCSQEGDTSTLIRCDECSLGYHFLCLDPPVKKSPKVRGYAWLCTVCSPDDSDDESYGQDEQNEEGPLEVDPSDDDDDDIVDGGEEDIYPFDEDDNEPFLKADEVVMLGSSPETNRDSKSDVESVTMLD